jgi:hypothetical protein
MRFFGLIAVLVVAASVAAASAQTQNGRADGSDSPPGVELTFKKWIAPSQPNFAGVVGGDFDGRFGGATLARIPDATGQHVYLDVIYIAVAADPAQSLTMRIAGIFDVAARTAELNGRVVDGPLHNARVHVEWALVSCTEAPNGTCFQGTLSVSRGSADSD